MQEFNNILPRTREQRLAMRDKQRIEQKRIEERTEGFQRNTDPFSLQKPDPTSDFHLAEQSRFDKNFSVHDKIAREKEYTRRLQAYQVKRQAQYERDNARWELMDEQLRSEQSRISKKAEIFGSAKRNKNSHPYNPLTLEYDQSAQGQNLKKYDDNCKYRAEMRGQNIYSKGNSSWNPLTGQPLDYHYAHKAPVAAPDHTAPGGGFGPGSALPPTFSRPF